MSTLSRGMGGTRGPVCNKFQNKKKQMDVPVFPQGRNLWYLLVQNNHWKVWINCSYPFIGVFYTKVMIYIVLALGKNLGL